MSTDHTHGIGGGTYTAGCPDCQALKRAAAARRRVSHPTENQQALAVYRAANPSAARKNNLKSYHNMTVEELRKFITLHGSVCGICGTDVPGGKHHTWAVDHDHKCCPQGHSCAKCRRGILCSPCNLGIGLLQDSQEILLAAVKYLRAHTVQL